MPEQVDLKSLCQALKTARGKRYYDILRAILNECGAQIVAEAQAIKAQGKFTAVDVGRLALKYDLNFKATCEHLEERGVLATGTYDLIVQSGLKVKDIFSKARADTQGKEASHGKDQNRANT